MQWLVATALRLRWIVLALVVAGIVVGLRVGARRAARRLPRVRAAARRSADRGAGPLDRRGGSAGHDADRAGPHRTRRSSPRCARSRCSGSRAWCCCSSAAPTSSARGSSSVNDWRASPATLPSVAHAPVLLSPLVVDEPRAQDRHHVDDAVADGALDARAVDDPPAADGRAGRGQRRDLGTA